MDWSTKKAQEYASVGCLEEFIHAYLNAGQWKNTDLSDGLKRAKRRWEGPVLIGLDEIFRTCGPEENMAFRIPVSDWEREIGNIAVGLTDPLELPPIILQKTHCGLYVRDGNHRVEAAKRLGWLDLWAVIWFDNNVPENSS